jgi:hypothetical protein
LSPNKAQDERIGKQKVGQTFEEYAKNIPGYVSAEIAWNTPDKVDVLP